MIDFSSIQMRTWAKLGSAGSFGVAAMEFPSLSEDILVLTADLCTFSGLDRFRAKFPDKLYNVGIAEQNMIGIAAGLAKEGYTVFATTYASFASTRSLEQIRLHLGYGGFNVKVVGMTSGLSVGILGGTHMALEDISNIRAIPNLTILSPADCTETIKATLAAAKHDGPVYLRLTGGMNNPLLYTQDYDFQIGRAVPLCEGGDVAIVATGSMVSAALNAAKLLQEADILCSVLNMHTLKPLDTQAIDKLCSSSRLLVTVEEHNVIGGLGSAIAEYTCSLRNAPPQLTIGVQDVFPHAASYEYLLEQCGLTAPQIAKQIRARLAH